MLGGLRDVGDLTQFSETVCAYSSGYGVVDVDGAVTAKTVHFRDRRKRDIALIIRKKRRIGRIVRAAVGVVCPELGGAGGDAVGDGLVDQVSAGCRVDDARKMFGGADGEASGVDVGDKFVGKVEELEAVVDPGTGASEGGGDAVDAGGMVGTEGLELQGLLYGGEGGTGGVFAETDKCRGDVVGGDKDGWDSLVVEELVGGEAVSAGDTFDAFGCGAEGDGVEEPGVLDVAGEAGDVVGVDVEAPVCVGCPGDGIKGDLADLWGLVRGVERG